MAVDDSSPGAGPILRFQVEPPPGPIDGVRVVVLDTSWTPGRAGRGDGAISLRDVAARVLAERDIFADGSKLLDDWAAASGVVEALSIEGTSFWFQARVRHGAWLQSHLLWLAIVDDLVRVVAPSAIDCGQGCGPELIDASRQVAARDGLPWGSADATDATSVDPSAPPAGTSQPSRHRSITAWFRRVGRRVARTVSPGASPDEHAGRRQAIAARVDILASDPGRLLVVMAHARQSVKTDTGERRMNVYLEPIADRLRETRLDPIEIEIGARVADDDAWSRLTALGAERVLSADALLAAPSQVPLETLRAWAEAVSAEVASSSVPVPFRGVDVGPALASQVAARARTALAGQALAVTRARTLIERLRPAAILIADEYHRQDWLAAASILGVPTIAVQHGLIYRYHNGYVHRDRPPELRLPSRTYVFGDWERRLLVETSVYRDDEVRVGGSPRLDLLGRDDVGQGDVRAELGVATGDRLVVVSGTWGAAYRQFYYPIALAALVDRPLPRTHLVVKLHPTEKDDGPYAEVIRGVAEAAGFEPPPVSVVRSIDLYRLLRAADAHVGIHSTVLTEAVVTGTRNLLADLFANSDLLGYVDAGVAIPIRDGGDLLAALEAASPDPDARRAFLDTHFRPGSASDRIASDLLSWPT